ncbi:MAG: NAD(P)/FAD-dependent oxidoreductase, partial [Candidatus Binataceae bacterium]
PWRRAYIPSTPFEPSPEVVDVAIVGGGLTGISAAYHLARGGLRPMVLEGGRVGDGASGRSGGIVLEGTAAGVMEDVSTCVSGLEHVVGDEHINCDLHLDGCWEIAHHAVKDMASALPWRDSGSPVSIVGTVAGGTVDPMALLSGLAHAAVQAGAVIHENAPVKRIDTSDDPALELDGGVIRARFVVTALNAWTGTLLPLFQPDSSALTIACATSELDWRTLEDIGVGPGLPFYTVDMPYLWGRLTADSRVIFGAGLAWGEPRELERLDLGAPAVRNAFTQLERRVHALHPALRRVEFSARWAGPIAVPNGMVPIIGRLPAAPRVFVAGGYSGHGVALSVCAGRLIALAITENAPLPSWGAPAR